MKHPLPQKHLVYSVLFLVMSTKGISQPQAIWSRITGNASAEQGWLVKSDRSGNLYHLGTIYGQVDLDPGQGSEIHGNTGATSLFIQKLDSNGYFLWARTFPLAFITSRFDLLNADVDPTGHTLLVLKVNGTVDIDPGPGTEMLGGGAGSAYIFVMLDSSGNLQWHKVLNTSYGIELPVGVAFDEDGSFYALGSFYDSLTVDGITLVPASSTGNSLFLLKADATGTLAFLKKLPVVKYHFSQLSDPVQISLSAKKGFGLAFSFFFNPAAVIDFNTDPLLVDTNTRINNPDHNLLAVGRFTESGDLSWVRLYDSINFDTSLYPYYDICYSSVTSNNEIVSCFRSSTKEQVQIHTLTGTDTLSAGSTNMVVFRHTASGQLAWSRSFDLLPGAWKGTKPFTFSYRSVLEDPLGNLIFHVSANQFDLDVDPGPGQNFLSSQASFYSGAIVSLKFNGNLNWFYPVKNTMLCGLSFSPDKGSLYASGWIDDQAELAGQPDSINLVSKGPSDAFLIKLGFWPPRVGFTVSDTLICLGDSLLLEFTDLRDGDRYLWSTGDSNSSLWAIDSGLYVLQVRNENHQFTDSVNLHLAPKPTVYIGPDSAFCDLVDILLDPKTSGSHFLWNTGDTTRKLYLNQDGTYSLLVKDSLSCSNTDTVLISKLASPLGFENKDTLVCSQILALDAGNPGATYLWNTGEVKPIIYVDRDGWYKVLISNGYCTITDSIRVSFRHRDSCSAWIFIPNAFTPDGNALNDFFFITYNGIRQFELRIYDRWGEEIYSTRDPDFQWDGSYKGREVPVGSYCYAMRCLLEENGQTAWKSFKGTLTVIR